MFEHAYYLIGLLVSIAGLLAIDHRLKLAFWNNSKRTTYTMLAGIAVFITWDLLGIGLGVFFHGNSRYSLPLRILPELPLEEFTFLFLLCYVTLLLYVGGKKLWPHTS